MLNRLTWVDHTTIPSIRIITDMPLSLREILKLEKSLRGEFYVCSSLSNRITVQQSDIMLTGRRIKTPVDPHGDENDISSVEFSLRLSASKINLIGFIRTVYLGGGTPATTRLHQRGRQTSEFFL